ncbi:MAG TPA: YciI family protein [Chryseolinea sp.]|nr:YciI family protein [Chryseolinea sp.]
MEKYMFIFIGGDPSHLSPEAQQANMQKWFEWIEKLTKEQRYVAGEALLPGGKTVKGAKRTVTDGPFAESKEVVGGFFVVNAKNLDDAVALTKDYPDYELGGAVEVREIQKFDM